VGADVAIDYTSEDFVKAVKAKEPAGVDVVFDCAGNEMLTKSVEVVKPGGVLVSICGQPDKEAATKKGFKAAFVLVNPNGPQLEVISGLIKDQKVKPPQYEVLPLEQAAKAMDLNQAGHVRGKVVLKI